MVERATTVSNGVRGIITGVAVAIVLGLLYESLTLAGVVNLTLAHMLLLAAWLVAVFLIYTAEPFWPWAARNRRPVTIVGAIILGTGALCLYAIELGPAGEGPRAHIDMSMLSPDDLSIDASLFNTAYKEGTPLEGGITWNSGLYETRIWVKNKTSATYSNVNLVVISNKAIWEIGIDNPLGGACSKDNGAPDLGATGTPIGSPMGKAILGGLVWHIHCDSIAAQNQWN